MRSLADVAAVAVLVLAPARALRAQSSLDTAVGQARQAWMRHDVQVLLEASDTVRLQLPGVGLASALQPGQAARLLDTYLNGSTEVAFTLEELRRPGPGRGYAQMRRVYVVRGTTDRQEETVFLGFDLIGGVWRLREVRVTP